LKRSGKVKFVADDAYFKEIAKIRNPHISDEKLIEELERGVRRKMKEGFAIYFPWKEVVCCVPSQKIFFELTTARNKHLVKVDEQNKLRNTVVSFFGMSVGSQAALTWMLESRADQIKIVDPDTIDPSNLNRVRFGVDIVGHNKVDVTEEGLFEINPFAKVYKFKSSETSKIKNIVIEEPMTNIIVEEIDDVEAKFELRKIAKDKKLPLVSAADVGDNVVLDVERYDVDSKVQPFLGRLPGIEKVNFSKLSRPELIKLIIKLVGFEADADRIPDSLMAMGGSLRTWPQLGATATIAGGIVATAVKKIILGENVKSGRYIFSLDEILNADFDSSENVLARSKKIDKINYLLEKY
jgi:molybdopterin/thiamine biosynthesis adenylyltransferase